MPTITQMHTRMFYKMRYWNCRAKTNCLNQLAIMNSGYRENKGLRAHTVVVVVSHYLPNASASCFRYNRC